MALKKTASKKTVTRKAAVRKKTATTSASKKVTARVARAPAKPKAITERQTKTQIVRAIAEDTELATKQVAAVFDSLNNIIQRHMMRRGSGEITIPETGIKIRRIRKPATKARKATNPFTGEPMVIKAKPARNSVRLTALKKMKESIA